MPRSCLAILLLPLLFSCSDQPRKKQQQVVSKDSFYTLDEKLRPFSPKFIDSVQQCFEPGFSGTVLIYKDGRIFEKAYGYRDYGHKAKMETTDIFQLASVSKTVTSVATLLLVQDGKLNLDSQVSNYLEDFPYAGVTVRQLLSHRSGLANYIYYTDTFWRDTGRCMNNDDFYNFMCKCKPKPYLDPGVSFSYCNTNFAFLAVLVERVSGMPFYQFVEEKIFKPCGMRNSFYYGHKPKRITGQVLVGRYEKYDYTDPYYLDGVLGDKSLYSCVDDLFMFHKALSDGRLVNDSLMRDMQTPSYRHNIFGGSYGLGFRLQDTPLGQWTYHNGWWRGFWTFFWNRFDKKACFIILTNNKRSSHVDKARLCKYLLEV